MIPQEWIDKYLEKSGDDKIVPTQYSHGCEHGFATWNIFEDIIIPVQVYGDGEFWVEFFKEMARRCNCKIQFATKRNPKAWSRKHGAKLVGYVMEIDP